MTEIILFYDVNLFYDMNYVVHPIHKTYAASFKGYVFDIERKCQCVMKKDIYGFLYFDLICDEVEIKYNLNKFVWECFNGVKPKNSVIINSGDQHSISLINLKLLKL